MNRKQLSNKPLVEAIFEIRWNLTQLSDGLAIDDLYDIMVGQLKQSFNDILPIHNRLPFAMIPGVSIPYQVQHQFRETAGGWPLLQLGPGVLTVNETENYDSSKFIKLCNHVYSTLVKFWLDNGREPAIAQVSLRYIDADHYEGAMSSFVNDLGIAMVYADRLKKLGYFKEDQQNDLHYNASFTLDDPKGQLHILVDNGKKHDRTAVVWQTQIISINDECNQFVKGPDQWLEKSHDICHDVFFAMIQGVLEEKYK